MRRLGFVIIFAVALALPSAASAQQQTINFNLGGFVARSFDARDFNDVLVQDLTVSQPLAFEISDFTGFTFGGEWSFPIGRYFDGAVGVNYYSKSVPSLYAGLVNSNGSEIEQDLKLRIVPFAATFRFLPMGRRNGLEPYIGGGVNVYYWRYEESGQFVDLSDNSIFNDTFVGSGGAVGPVILGGVRYNFDPLVAGGEIRWQGGKGDLPGGDQFLGTTVDLGGVNYLFTIGLRF